MDQIVQHNLVVPLQLLEQEHVFKHQVVLEEKAQFNRE
jgi:hypothetical protein